MAEYQVIDLSHYNSVSDFLAVKNAGIYGVILRAGTAGKPLRRTGSSKSSTPPPRPWGCTSGPTGTPTPTAWPMPPRKPTPAWPASRASSLIPRCTMTWRDPAPPPWAETSAPRSPKPSATPWSRRATERGYTPTPTGGRTI